MVTSTLFANFLPRGKKITITMTTFVKSILAFTLLHKTLNICKGALTHYVAFVALRESMFRALYYDVMHCLSLMPMQCKGQHGFYMDCHCYLFLLLDKGHRAIKTCKKSVFIVLPLPYGGLQ